MSLILIGNLFNFNLNIQIKSSPHFQALNDPLHPSTFILYVGFILQLECYTNQQ